MTALARPHARPISAIAALLFLADIAIAFYDLWLLVAR